MDYDKFFTDFYKQQKQENLRKAALKQRLKIAALTIGGLCLIIIIL